LTTFERIFLVAGLRVYRILCDHFNQLLDRGWCRSGCYLYKPNMEKTCCPQYTIRLDIHKFVLSRSQKRVLRRMNDFLLYDKKPKSHSKEKSSDSKSNCQATKQLQTSVNDSKSPIIQTEFKKSERSLRGTKKKQIRKERALQRMRDKGIDVDEVYFKFEAGIIVFQQKRIEKEFARRRTLHSYVLDNEATTFKHRLEIRLVSVNSEEFESMLNESFSLFEKYQSIVHHDEDRSLEGFIRFLVKSPLFSSEDETPSGVIIFSKQNIIPPTYALGSYHQQYILDDQLIAVAAIDILPRCLSAKYLFYDPDYDFLNLGTYSALREILFTMELSKYRPDLHYYYMGYYIDSCPKMQYKSQFRPSDLLCDYSFTWVPVEKCVERLRQSGKKFVVFAPDKSPPKQIPVKSVLCSYEWYVFNVGFIYSKKKGVVLPYGSLLRRPNFKETESFMEEYARLIGPLAKEIILYRTP
uniref:Arginyl-tRNA--protein transferase 1 n=1 Tax=Dracunculus medinensis TaxID=318479 RepID=A0A0N4U8I6_DRAME